MCMSVYTVYTLTDQLSQVWHIKWSTLLMQNLWLASSWIIMVFVLTEQIFISNYTEDVGHQIINFWYNYIRYYFSDILIQCIIHVDSLFCEKNLNLWVAFVYQGEQKNSEYKYLFVLPSPPTVLYKCLCELLLNSANHWSMQSILHPI